MTARVNWKQVAERLADRLATHAFCPQHGVSDADPDCPFCQDRAVYRAYLAVGGRDQRPAADPNAKSVALQDLPAAEHLGWAALRTAEDGTHYTEFLKEGELNG
jgi:hypothetical protein